MTTLVISLRGQLLSGLYTRLLETEPTLFYTVRLFIILPDYLNLKKVPEATGHTTSSRSIEAVPYFVYFSYVSNPNVSRKIRVISLQMIDTSHRIRLVMKILPHRVVENEYFLDEILKFNYVGRCPTDCDESNCVHEMKFRHNLLVCKLWFQVTAKILWRDAKFDQVLDLVENSKEYVSFYPLYLLLGILN